MLKNVKKLTVLLIVVLVGFLVTPSVNAAARANTDTYFKTGRVGGVRATSSSAVHKDAVMPKEYSFALGEKYSSTESGGGVALTSGDIANWNDFEGESNFVGSNGNYSSQAVNSVKGNFYVIYKNAGKYKGTNIDVKLTIIDFSVSDRSHIATARQSYNAALVFHNENTHGLIGVEALRVDWVEVKYEFFKAGTTTPISVKGYTTYWDIDLWQGIHFLNNNTGLYADSRTQVNYVAINEVPYIYTNVKKNIKGTYNAETTISETFSGTTMTRVYTFSRPKDEDGSAQNCADSTSICRADGGMWNSPIVHNSVKKYAPDTPSGDNNSAVKVGDKIKYEIQFTNGDPDSTVNVTIKDTISKGLDYDPNSAKIGSTAKEPTTITENADGSKTLTWNATLHASTSSKLTYNVKVTSAAEQIVNNSAIVTIGDHEYTLDQLKNPVPKKTYASDSPSGKNHAAVKKNDNIKYSIKYANASDETSTVTITDTLSKGLSYNDDAKVGNTTISLKSRTPNSDGSTTYVWEKTVAPGATEELTYSAKVTGTTSLVQNNAKIKYDNDPEIDLNILKNPIPSKTYASDSPSGKNNAAVKKNDSIKYSIKYGNASDETSTVTITDTLSKGLSYNDDAKVGNTTVNLISTTPISVKGYTTYWDIDLWQGIHFLDSNTGLYADSRTNVNYTTVNSVPYIYTNVKTNIIGTYNASTSITETFSGSSMNRVFTFSRPADGVAGNCADSTSICRADGGIANSEVVHSAIKKYATDTESGADGAEVKPGDKIKYEIRYTNGDINDSATVTIKDILSKGLEYVSGSSSLGNPTITNNADGTTTLTWTTTLAKSSSSKMTYQAQVVEGYANNKVNNSATATIGTHEYELDQLENPITKKGKVITRYLEQGTNRTLATETEVTKYYGESYTTSAKTITNYDYVNSEGNTSGTVAQDETIVVYYYKAKQGTLIVHHYKTGTTTKLLDDETSIKNYGDSYTTSSKEDSLPYYDFDSSSNNTTGTINQDETVVTYFYKPKRGEVIAKYLEKGTNKELASSTSATYDYGTTYTTREGNVSQNYNLDSVSGEVSGEVNKPTTEVIYYYVKKASNIDDEITKTGTEEIKRADSLIDYTIKYGAKITDYIGDVEITITDKLPYEIDESASNLDGGTYNRATKTITWKVTKNNYNSYTAEKINITKNIKVKFTNIDNTARTMVNEVTGNIKLDNGESTVTDESVTRTNIEAQLIVHHYKKGTTTSVYPDETTTKNYGDSYTTSSKESQLPNYDLDSNSGNTTGTINQDETVVTYYYKLKKGTVITKYLEKGTNKELASSTSNEYDYGATYTTSQSSQVPQNYNLDSVDGEVSGEVNKPSTEVIYYYVKKASNIDDEITKTGTEEIVSTDTLIDYTIKYGAKITDYIGDVEITITDKLPYEIDESASDLDGGTYNRENKTITWKETKNNYNSFTAEKINITKTIKVKFTNIDKTKKSMINEVTGNIKLDNGESTVTDQLVTRTNINATLIVHHYIKGTTTKLIDDEESIKNYGDSYTTSSKESQLPNYDLDSNSGNTTGTINQDETVVTYYYKLKKGIVITKHLEKGTNKELASSTSNEYDYGETYTTREGNVPQNYNLESVDGEVTGEINKPTTEVIYYYVKKASNIDDEITKTGTDEITSSDSLIDYTIKYGAKITDYIGDVEITITDKLPYEIDESASNLDGGTYNRENKTITWKVTKNNYNSYTAEKINITKNIKVKFTNIDNTARTMVNEVTGYIKLDNGDSTVTTEKITKTEIKGTLTVKYVDTKGKEIANTVNKEGLVGEQLNTEAKDIGGYTLVKKPESEVIILKEGNIEVKYVYEKIKYNIITRALTEGGTIEGDEIVNHGENSKKRIKIRTDEAYVIKNLYINGKKQKIQSDLEKLTLPIFKNVTENKLVEVEFEMVEIVKVPDTGSKIAVLGIISGVALVGTGGYFIYKRYKQA